MSTRPTTHPTGTAPTNQTPFDRFKAAVSKVMSVPKASLSLQKKKARKK